jgi:tripartite-type tricarboxylate transporter receptor subunit TctC
MKNKLIALIILTLSMTLFASTEQYKQNVEFTVMHGVGGVSDITSRYIANNLKGNYTVMNRPGGGGRIALNHLLNNNTMMLATMVQVFVTNPINFQDLEYNPAIDLEVIAIVGVMPSLLICNKNAGFKSFDDLLKSKKQIIFGFGGYGSSEHMATELLVFESKVDVTMVPYPQGGNRAVTDVMGGHIDCMFANYPTIKSQVANKNLIILMTSHELGYNVPTWHSVYKKDFSFQSYLSIIVSAKMDIETKNRISLDLKQSFSRIYYKQGLQELGIFPSLITDKNKIKNIVDYMDNIKKFILEKNIKTTG